MRGWGGGCGFIRVRWVWWRDGSLVNVKNITIIAGIVYKKIYTSMFYLRMKHL